MTQVSKPMREDSRTVRTRDALRRATLLLIEEQPFDHIAVRDIVAKAGIGYATFFRHYRTKAAVLDDIAAHEIKRLVETTTTALNTENARAAALALAVYVSEHKALWSALFNGGASDTMRQEFIRISVEYTEKQPHRSDWLPSELASVHNASANLEIIAWWLRQPVPIPIEQLALILDRLVITPILDSSSLAVPK